MISVTRTFCHAAACAVLFFLTACSTQGTEEVFMSSDEDAVNAAEVSVRSVDNDMEFPDGAEVRLYATGGLQIPQGKLVYSQSSWRTDHLYAWAEGTEAAHVVAIYPYQERYDVTTLYDADGNLLDVLCQVLDVPAREPLTLTFSHRFARVEVRLDEGIVSQVCRMALSVPAQVKELSPYTGHLLLDAEECVTSVRDLDGQTSSVWFIVPVDVELVMTLDLTWRSGDVERVNVSPVTLEENMGYYFTVRY